MNVALIVLGFNSAFPAIKWGLQYLSYNDKTNALNTVGPQQIDYFPNCMILRNQPQE